MPSNRNERKYEDDEERVAVLLDRVAGWRWLTERAIAEGDVEETYDRARYCAQLGRELIMRCALL